MNLDDLERLAKAATPGPWDAEARTNAFWSIQAPAQAGYAAQRIADVTQNAANAAYIAAASPDTMLALLAVVRAAKEAERLLTNLQPHIPQACYPSHAAFIDNYVDPSLDVLRAALASLEGIATPPPSDQGGK